MSGIEISTVAKEKDAHVCTSCMNSVIQTFNFFQEQIKKLRSEKANLQEEIKKLRKTGKEKTRVLAEEIRALEDEVATLKRKSESLEGSGGNVA